MYYISRCVGISFFIFVLSLSGFIFAAANENGADSMDGKAAGSNETEHGRDFYLASPLVSANPILYVSRPQFPYEHHNTETTYQTDEICVGKMPQTGSSLKLWYPKTGRLTTVLEVPGGIVRDPCVHFDAKRILVSIRWDFTDDFHLYELDLTKHDIEKSPFSRNEVDQLTYGSGLSDIDPQYLPDGRIVFSSSREPKYCMCNRHIMMNLHVMNGDGSNVLQIGHSTLYEGHSSLLPDGRILYYRWEYVDRNFPDAEGAWTVNPDGTNHALFWGNNTESPATTIDPRIIPGASSEYICTMTACHSSPWGAIGMIDRQKGLDGKTPILQVWPQDAWNLIGTYTGKSYDELNRLSQFFEDPWPLDDSHILAAGTLPKGTVPPKGAGETENPGVTGLWLLTLDGKMCLLHTDPVGCFDPMPLAASEAPPVITDRVDLSKDYGTFYVTNVNEGFGMEKVSPERTKYLRVIEAPEKRYWTYPGWVGVDAKGNLQAPAMNWDEFGNKRILGTVPVEEDGSVYFKLPADRFVFFQLLDENKEMIQSMRSGVMVRPGENNGCYGCHEDRLETPVSTKVTKAVQNPPCDLTPEFGRSPFLFSYAKEVQPVLDQYCVCCHDWPTEKTAPLARRASEKVILCGDLNPLFNQSYWQIREKKLVSVIGSAYAEKIKPLVWGARRSRLIDIMKNGHDQGGAIDQARQEMGVGSLNSGAIEIVSAWVDLNGPYYPDFSSGFPDNHYGRSPLSFSETGRLAELTGYAPVNEAMAWGGRIPNPLEPAVSFSRPAMSPCLSKWNTAELRQSPEYKESLALIQTGAERLKALPREDMPDWKRTSSEDVRRHEKYDVMKERARRMQEAASTGQKLLDRDNQLPLGNAVSRTENGFTTIWPIAAFTDAFPFPSGHNEYTVAKLIDRNPDTFACLLDTTCGGGSAETVPANASAPVTGHVILDFGKPIELSGLRFTSRRLSGCFLPNKASVYSCGSPLLTSENHQLIVKDKNIPKTADGKSVNLAFPEPVSSRYFKIQILDSYECGPKHYNFQFAEISGFQEIPE